MLKRIKVLIFSLLCLNVSYGSVSSLVIIINNELELDIIFDTTFVGTWSSVHYDKCQDTIAVKNYLNLIHQEFGKYPVGFFKNIGVSKLIIASNLTFNNQKRAALPDPYQNALYLGIDSTYSRTYLIHVMHHELHHCTEYSVWHNMYFDWRKWKRKNTFRFKYGSGGEIAYEEENKFIDWRSIVHPQKGFVNLYSTTGQEEDRSEIMAIIMTDEESFYLFKYCVKDKRLKRKVKLILKFLNNVSESESNFWKTEMEGIGKKGNLFI